jgi:rSAM/selenodomain-associated transferase 1
MTSDRLLMIFAKNPELGKVKTRLAETIGDEKALTIYKNLLHRTNQVTMQVNTDRAIFYYEYVDDDDIWNNFHYRKYLQEGVDLGERMMNAFALAFEKGYHQTVIIGSDCYDLTPELIESAFDLLLTNDVVIGPAQDGGYYLLAMNQYHREVFSNKQWSTENVLLDTLLDLKQKGITYELLETLSDVDREEDLGMLKNLIE